MTDQIAEYVAVGSGRMTVIQSSPSTYQFRITGRKHILTISDDEAIELALTILGRSGL